MIVQVGDKFIWNGMIVENPTYIEVDWNQSIFIDFLKKSGRFWDLRTYQSWIQTTAFQEIQGHRFRVSKKRENPQEIRPYY